MDKYIDEFCDRHFAEFEQLGLKNCTDGFFDHPRMRPGLFVRIALVVSIALVVASVMFPFEIACRSCLLKDLGLGLLTSSLVAFYFNLRDESIRYYGKLIDLIERRMLVIDLARHEANEHLMNVSMFEGLQLLQFTVQNALHFAGYVDDKMNGRVVMNIAEGLTVERDLGDNIDKEEMLQHVQNARRTIDIILKRLQSSKKSIRSYAWNEKGLGARLV